MSTCPSFKFYIPGAKGPVSFENDLWHLPLSGNSGEFLKKVQAPGVVTGPEPTIGDYFLAARTFLEKENGQLLATALSLMAGKGGENDPIRAVELFLEKHGAFYHPLRVKVLSKTGRSATLVLNGAVSKPGLALIKKEYQLLANLEKQAAIAYTPRVFGAGIQALEISHSEKAIFFDDIPLDATPIDFNSVGFFLGEWFEGFREFHISDCDGESKVAVWSSNGDVEYLSLARAAVIYEQIAHILTTYYNPNTGEQIHPWHHAAGDFVVDPLAEGLPVKLITVRGYESLMEVDPSEGSGGHILPALLFFFLNLTLRIQMDRLDGVGPLVFLGEGILRATVTGFLRGLAAKTEHVLAPEVPGPREIPALEDIFVEFMAEFSREQIEAILTNLIDAWPINASERTIAGAHLKSHAIFVHSQFKNY
jgi:hypothetical protein